MCIISKAREPNPTIPFMLDEHLIQTFQRAETRHDQGFEICFRFIIVTPKVLLVHGSSKQSLKKTYQWVIFPSRI